MVGERESENQHGGGGRCTYPAPGLLERSKNHNGKHLQAINPSTTKQNTYLVVLCWQLCIQASSEPFMFLGGWVRLMQHLQLVKSGPSV